MKAIKEIGVAKAIRFIIFGVVQLISTLLFIPQLRSGFLKLLGVKIGRNCIIYNIKFMNLYRGSLSNLEIGDNCFVGNDVLFDLAGKISLDNDVTISDRTILLTHLNIGYKSHPLQKIFPATVGEVKIKKGVFVGIASIILPSVTINQLSVVGAGSVVTRDIGPKKVSAGVPCKEIHSISI